MKKLYALLGADDPEMRAIMRLLKDMEIPFALATVKGERATPGNSYRIDRIRVPDGRRLVVVECAFVGMPDSVIVIDHHRPGDPGFAFGPKKFWEASSIGQLHKLLGIEPSHKALVMAAFDHCFAAAVQGKCKEVTKQEVIHLRIVELSDQAGVSGLEVWERTTVFRNALRKAPEIIIGKQAVKDLCERHLGVGYSLDYLTAQLAAFMEDHAVLLRHNDHAREAEKYTLTGHATAATVQTFITEWASSRGLERAFGVPERGYAGAYKSRRRSSRTA